MFVSYCLQNCNTFQTSDVNFALVVCCFVIIATMIVIQVLKKVINAFFLFQVYTFIFGLKSIKDNELITYTICTIFKISLKGLRIKMNFA
jgi:hypothetical protein